MKRTMAKSEKTLLAVALSVAMSAVLYSLVIEPLVGQWSSLHREAEKKALDLTHDLRLVSEYPKIKAEFVRLHQLAKSAKKGGEEAAGALSDIEAAAGRAQMELMSLKPKGGKRIGNYTELFVEVNTEADPRTLVKFLYDIENGEKLFKVKHMTVLGSNNQGTLRCSFLISKIFTS